MASGLPRRAASQRDAPEFETLVVDNGSTRRFRRIVRMAYPCGARGRDRRPISALRAAITFGVRAAHGEWLVFLNNDTVPDPRLARASVGGACRASRVFADPTSRLVFLHDPSIVDSAGDGYLRAGGAFKHGHGAPAESFADSREVFGACGGALMIRRDAFEALGGFDERFFMQYEDVDLSYRARLRGQRVWYAADAIVHHAGSGSLGTVTPAAVYYGQRNLEWTWIKNTPGRLLLRTATLARDLFALPGVLHYVGMAAAVRRCAGSRRVPRAAGGARRSPPGAGLAGRGRRRRPRALDGAALARRQAPRKGVCCIRDARS